ncbi:N-acetylneuraminate synthase family protein [Halobacteriovorax sp. YZS-1-1]|uniref:N-acetylneuraminate synthase family protein n=1 Tax=unclassified Halobacteriovorax TaxID=2639665 RepID=UPI00399B87A7
MNKNVYIIGEVGLNHNGSVENAKQLIRIAKDSGCDAVKFQKRTLSKVYSSEILENLKNFEQGFQYLIPILEDYELSEAEMSTLNDFAKSIDIDFICTPFDTESADFINSLGVESFKIASADLTNLYLIDHLSKFNKKLIISTGMSTYEQIDKTVDYLKSKNIEFSLLHCVSSYPVNYTDANMSRIKELRKRYGVDIGYSGHDEGISLSLAAVALGASIIEKHITLDKNLRGPDHKFSLLPNELKELCTEIRKVEASLEVRDEAISQGERLNSMVFRKSLFAKTDIKAGTIITSEMLIAKGPDNGLSVQSYFDLLGMKSKRDMNEGDIFYESDLIDEENSEIVTSVNWAKQGYVVRYHDFETVLDYDPACLEFHFTYKDTTLDIPFDKFEKYSDKLKNIILRIHCCEYIGEELFDICNQDIERRLKAQNTLQRVIDITSQISKYFSKDKPLIVFNCGAMSLNDKPNTLKIAEGHIYKHFSDLDLKNTGLIAQNMPPYPWYYGGQWRGHYFLEPDELIKFCEETGERLCLDTSHGYMAATYLGIDFNEYVEKLLPYVEHLHISDATGVEGEGTQIGTGDIDFKSLFSIIKNFKGTWIPEIWQGHVNNNYEAKKALKIIRDFVE